MIATIRATYPPCIMCVFFLSAIVANSCDKPKEDRLNEQKRIAISNGKIGAEDLRREQSIDIEIRQNEDVRHEQSSEKKIKKDKEISKKEKIIDEYIPSPKDIDKLSQFGLIDGIVIMIGCFFLIPLASEIIQLIFRAIFTIFSFANIFDISIQYYHYNCVNLGAFESIQRDCGMLYRDLSVVAEQLVTEEDGSYGSKQ